MEASLKRGTLVFSKSVVVKEEAGFSGFRPHKGKDFFSIFLGACDTGKNISKKEAYGILNSMGWVAVDQIEDYFGTVNTELFVKHVAQKVKKKARKADENKEG